MSRPTDGFSAMMRVLPTAEHHSEEIGAVASATDGQCRPSAPRLLPLRRRRLAADRQEDLSAAGRRPRARSRSGAASLSRRQPHVEPRPLAARRRALAAPAPLHGEVGALEARAAHACCAPAGSFPVRRGEGDIEALETAIRLCREGRVMAMFPEGTRRTQGPAQEAPAAPPHGHGADRARSRRSARPGGDPRHGPALATRAAPRPLRAADPARRPEGARRRAQAAHEATAAPLGRDPAPRGRARRRGVNVAGAARLLRPLLAIDGDSLAHRAFHALPKTIRDGDRPPGEHDRRVREHARRRSGTPSSRAPSSSAGTRSTHADLPERAVPRLPGRPRVPARADRAARPAARALLRLRLRLGEGGRLRGRRLPRGRGARPRPSAAAGRSS